MIAIQNNPELVYMWEDKGPSYTKLTKDQYLKAGKSEMEKNNYEEVINNPIPEVKTKVIEFVQKLKDKGEIFDKVADYLLTGKAEISKFYHILKTHKIPIEIEDPKDWLEEHGFPIRSIISSIGSPTEQLGGFVDHFLQPGMKNLPSYLRDTKHTLQVIEDLNEQIENSKVSLDDVALVSLDIVNMYPSMSEEIGIGACKDFLEERDFSNLPEELKVKTESILEALNICIKNNYFKFDKKTYRVKEGVGIGQKVAPPYACLGVAKIETLAFTSDCDLLQNIVFWKQFIDVISY